MTAKILTGALLVILGVIALVCACAFGLWMMIPLAFPLLAFTYWNALALSWIIFFVGLPWLVKD
jgi:hypothetical protein